MLIFHGIFLREGTIYAQAQVLDSDIEFGIRHVVGSSEMSVTVSSEVFSSITKDMIEEAKKVIEVDVDSYLLKIWEVDPGWFPTPLHDGPETVWVRYSPIALRSEGIMRRQTRYETYGAVVKDYFGYIMGQGPGKVVKSL